MLSYDSGFVKIKFEKLSGYLSEETAHGFITNLVSYFNPWD